MAELDKKIERAIKLIQSAGKIAKEHGQPLEIAYSGGKDSDVILELAKMSGVEYRAIYKNTTIDQPGTIRHALDNDVEMVMPKVSFFEIIRKKGFPTRRARFCCEVLKEYKILDYIVLGIRRDESVKRAKRYKEPEVCRTYNKKEKVRQYFPILDWKKEDVAKFIELRKIKCHPLYYDEKGSFHPERRLGCMCCPLANKNTRLNEFKKYPNLVKCWIKAGDLFLKNHPNCKTLNKFKNAKEMFFNMVFCKNYADYLTKTSVDLFGNKLNCEEFINDYFNLR